ncbi:hypothetical protein [Flavobacterium sp.]|uniref:hypothetical protein n=1 Tax=Flavobacterium sp. TaxID=239 RepID=UPI0008AC4ED1|nr:hypothetical protein [Flavobacterium sp.]OGS60829.1 MAG: hypothetical protein A2X07_01850 [Flavobacteria bacterium GWF1_32_7]HBD26361.1 hypothetical protein [Flavobacterium sp.]
MINKENTQIFNDNIFKLLNNIIPGIVILEVFFNQGFFSKTPENLFSFFLFLIWSYLLSTPFNLFDSFDFEKLIKKLTKDKLKLKSESEQKIIKDNLEKSLEESKNELDKINDIAQFLYILLYIILICISYKFLNNFFIISSFWGINVSFMKLFICIVFVFILTIPFRYLANKWFYNYLKKELKID